MATDTIFAYIFIVLAGTFLLASIGMVSINKWMAAYMAATAFVCIATVGMAYGEPTEPAPAPATSAAISALYTASDSAQRAIDENVCTDAEDAHLRLDREARRQYDHVHQAFMVAAAADPNAVFDFCLAAGER